MYNFFNKFAYLFPNYPQSIKEIEFNAEIFLKDFPKFIKPVSVKFLFL